MCLSLGSFHSPVIIFIPTSWNRKHFLLDKAKQKQLKTISITQLSWEFQKFPQLFPIRPLFFNRLLNALYYRVRYRLNLKMMHQFLGIAIFVTHNPELYFNIHKCATWISNLRSEFYALYIRCLLRFEYQLPHPILCKTLPTDKKWPLSHFHISYQNSEISWQKMGLILVNKVL